MSASLANAIWCAASALPAAAFERALNDPARAQEAILLRFLRENADTAYGREHGLADIRTHEQFARRVPPRSYEELLPWIERIRRGEPRVLTAEPVDRLVPTGGSTAARKLIPYTASFQRELNRAIGPWIFDLHRRHPGALRGPAYWSVTPVAQDAATIDNDSIVPVGFDDDADYLGGWQRRVISAAMAVPSVVRTITSIDDWRFVTLLQLLRRRDLSLISVWHPSFLELLFKALEANWDRLVEDISSGGCRRLNRLAADVARVARFRPLPGRARELSRIGPTDFARLWPKLRVVSCWADAAASSAAASLARTLAGVALQGKGLLATEGVVSIPYAGRHPVAVRTHFLEFEDDAGGIRLADDLRHGATYQVLLTTAGGLCRYRLHDLVQVDGQMGRTPTIRFVGRAGAVSDRAGEKLTDSFVRQVLAELFCTRGEPPSFAMLAPDFDAAGCRYTLYVNSPAALEAAAPLDELLARNPQYAYCRKLGQLLPARIALVRGDAFVAYTDRLMSIGQRLGEIKPASLSLLDGWSAFLLPPDAAVMASKLG